MASSIAEHFVNAIREERAFIPILIESLRLDSITDFDLYLQVRPDEPLVLYAESNIPFTEASRRRLVESQIEFLYISANHQDSYRRYLEENLSGILKDPSIPMESKTEILYSSAHGLMRELFEDPEMEGGLERSRELVWNTVDFMHSERSALRLLIETAATDYQAYTHSVNGCVLGIALAQRIGFGDPKRLLEFGAGAILRDIGMTQIDPAIRNNPGKLTVSEFEEVKQHTLAGENMLRRSGEDSAVVLDLVRHHHERRDGTGYPDGLRGDEITPMARILGIADIFDAMTMKRAFKRRLTTFEALRLMSVDMHRELDPDFLRAFISMMGNPGL